MSRESLETDSDTPNTPDHPDPPPTDDPATGWPPAPPASTSNPSPRTRGRPASGAGRRLFWAATLGGLLALAVLATPWALRFDPGGAYAAAVSRSLGEDARAGEAERFLSSLATLTTAAIEEREWSGGFTDRGLNAWIAKFLDEDLAASGEVARPRVVFRRNRAELFVEVKAWAGIPVLIRTAVATRVAAPDALELTFENARAGLAPIPIAIFARELRDALALPETAGQLEWRQDDDRLSVRLRFPRDPNGAGIQGLRSLQIADGEIRLAGRRDFDFDPPANPN